MTEPSQDRLPAYDDLPRAARGGRSAWGLFGPQDSAGLLNLQTPDRIAAAARLVRSGEVYSLNAPTDLPGPPGWNGSRGDEEMARYLWNAHVAAVAADNRASNSGRPT